MRNAPDQLSVLCPKTVRFQSAWQPYPNTVGQNTGDGAWVSAMAKGWLSFLAVCLAGFSVLYQVEVDQDRWVAAQTITLKASAGDAFRFVTTSEYMSKARLCCMGSLETSVYSRDKIKWLPFVSSVFEADGKQMSVGKRYRATYEFPLLGEFDMSYSVVEYQPHRLVAVESDSWLRPRLELRVETSSEAQCRMHVLISFRRRSYLFQKPTPPQPSPSPLNCRVISVTYTLGPVLHFVSNQQLQRSLFLLRMVFPQ
ncbi:hypothetical protein HPB50_028280 [Hyalomma asiaticum]|nr:hypothetical protein HPB50_028280 [Hyalomma asiaticum]